MTEKLTEVLAELVAREPLFHRKELGTSRMNFQATTAPDFWEVGASGKVSIPWMMQPNILVSSFSIKISTEI